MSLAPVALRFACVRMLRGATLVGQEVHDSRIAPLDQMAAGDSGLFVVVSTENERIRALDGFEVLRGDRTIDLVIEILAASPADAPEAPDGQVRLVIPATDAGLELSINLVERQVMRCVAGEAGGPWGKVFRAIALQVREMVSRRAASAEGGHRYAARQIVLTVETVGEPPFGRPPVGAWAELMAAIDAEPEYAALGAALRAVIEGEPIPKWDAERAWASLRPEAAAGIGIASTTGEREAPPPLLDVVVEPLP